MDRTERAARLNNMLRQIAPKGALESLEIPSSIGQASPLEVFRTEAHVYDSAVDKLSRDAPGELSDTELYNLEAIVLPLNRPAVFVKGSSYDDLPAAWSHLNTADLKQRLGSNFLRSVV
jgi:hypothetical protein